MKRVLVVASILLAGPTVSAEAQDKSAEERATENGLGTIFRVRMMAEQKEAQCLRAVGNPEFCRCIGTKLLSMDFVQYVALMAKTGEEVDRLSAEDKKTVDVARKCRDLCLK